MPNKDVIVGIVAKPTEQRALELTKEIITWLENASISYRLDHSAAELASITDKKLIVKREELTTVCNPIVVLGGDGTFISVSRHPAEVIPTIIGVNMGSLGFLTEILTSEVFTALEEVLEGKAPLSQRFLLSAELFRNDKLVASYSAMNDVVLTKEALARIFGIEVEVNGNRAAFLRGDGVIIASPCGSTAYSLAAGGSIVHPQVNALLLTPICPHSLSGRPMVLPADSEIVLNIGPEMDEKEMIYLTVDGQEGKELQPGDKVKVTTSSHSFYVANSTKRSYFNVLGEKLGWAFGAGQANNSNR